MLEYSSVCIEICVIVCNINFNRHQSYIHARITDLADFDSKHSSLVLYTYLHIFIINIFCVHNLQNLANCEFLSSL